MQVNLEIYRNDMAALQKLWEAAHLDALTHLFNRYGMESWITERLEEMSPSDTAAMMMIDVDNFKYVNDAFGHMLGDALLVDIADIIREIFPNGFFCGRIGGDEYQIFGLNVDQDIVCQKADSLCQQIKNKYEKGRYNISISVGVAFSNEKHGRNYAELYKMADLALYQAKSNGKNGYMLYGAKQSMQVPQKRRCYQDNGSAEPIQLGESGFSVAKLLVDAVIDELSLKHDPKTTIENVSKCIVDALDVTRAYASCYTRDEMSIGRSYYYAQNDDPNITPNLRISGQEYKNKCFNSENIFFCTDIEKTIEPIKTELKRMQVKTLLQVLIVKDGRIIGTLGINNCGYKRLWLQSEIEAIHTIAKLMTDTIYELQESLEERYD